MRALRNVIGDIRRGENIDTYATIFISLGLVVASLLGIDTSKWIGPITLAVLALLAISDLRTRHSVSEQLHQITLPERPRLIRRSELPPLRQRGRFASEICIAAHTLMVTVIPEMDFLEEKMRNGCRLRFLLLHPDSPGLESLNEMIKVPISRNETEQSLTALSHLKQLEKITPGKCDFRLTKITLPLLMESFDPRLQTASIDIELIAYQRSKTQRPCFTLTRQSNAEWFEFFQDQFEELWQQSA